MERVDKPSKEFADQKNGKNVLIGDMCRMIAIDFARVGKAICGALLFLFMTFIAYGFAEICRTSDDKFEKVISIVEIVLYCIFAIVIFY